MLRPIMIVEDDPMDLELTRQAFSRRKLANPLLVARDGAEVLEWFSRWEGGETLPAVILMDLHLPKVSGLEVLRAIKTHSRLKMLPVVVLTSSDEDKDIQTAYLYGANSYIVKPVDFNKFQDVIAQIDMYWAVVNVLPETYENPVR